MAHEKVYAICENKCHEETMTKSQIQNMCETNYIRTYKSLTEISTGFNVGTRLDTVVNAMEAPSIAMYTVTAGDNAYYPTGTNKVTINKFADGSMNIMTEVDGIRYTKDTFVGAYNQYNNNWAMLSKILLTKTGSITLNAGVSMFTNIINDLSGYGDVIPIFTFTSLGGLSTPPKINVSTLVESNMLWLCASSSETYTVTFNYTVILLGV